MLGQWNRPVRILDPMIILNSHLFSGITSRNTIPPLSTWQPSEWQHHCSVRQGTEIAISTTAEPSVGELRFIARLRRSTLPNGYPVSYTVGGTAIEGSDVFMVSGQTRSKFYSSRQFIDDQVHGVTGSSIGAYMVIPGIGYEGASGGPFMRDINNQGGQYNLHCKARD